MRTSITYTTVWPRHIVRPIDPFVCRLITAVSNQAFILSFILLCLAFVHHTHVLKFMCPRIVSDLSILLCEDSSAESATKRSFHVSSRCRLPKRVYNSSHDNCSSDEKLKPPSAGECSQTRTAARTSLTTEVPVVKGLQPVHCK